MAEYKRRNVYFLGLVLDDGYTFAIVEYFDRVFFAIYIYFNNTHVGVTLLVVSRIHFKQNIDNLSHLLKILFMNALRGAYRESRRRS